MKTNFIINRLLMILMLGIIVSFNSLSAADVTFSVDMNDYPGTADFLTEGVTVNGTFNDWCGDCNPLSDPDADGIYEVTLDLPNDSFYEFKYTVGAWVDQEMLTEGSSCTLTTGGNTNRTLVVGDVPVVMPTNCWNSCNECGFVPSIQDVTFSVDMNEYAGAADYLSLGVTLNGTFNDWCGACNPMSDADMDGVYDVTIPLSEGFYEFKYTIGPWTDQEALTPGTACTMTTGPNTNRTLTVGTAPVVFATSCWNSCDACGVAPAVSAVTFSVDMNEYPGTADYLTEGVTVNGTFNDWCGACAQMDDSDSDGVYELTIDLPNNAFYEFKYTVGAWVDQEALTEGSSCTLTTGGNTNRTLVVGDVPVNMPTNCWNSCEACGIAPVISDVTFSVDMNSYDGPADYLTEGVTVNGTFNDWCGDCAPMDDSDSDGVYELTIPLEVGTYEFKYVIGNWVDQEFLAEGSSCTVSAGGFTNRALTVGEDPVILPLTCFEACVTCDLVPPSYMVSFAVDMNEYTGGQDYVALGVNVNGTFNNWCGTCWPLDDSDADGIYTATFPVDSGAIEFKYVIGDWAEGEEFIGGESCTANIGGFWNRYIENINSDLVLDVNCFNSCEACGFTGGDCPAPDAIICDNIDDYTLGSIEGQAAHWAPWSAGGTVSNVSDAHAFSNSQSLYVGPGGAEDNLLLLGDRVTGQWTVDWMAYVPADSTGFFNIQADPTAGNAFIYQAFFNAGGAAPGVGSFQTLPETFSYPEDQWFSVSLSVDLDAVTHSLTIDGVAVLTDAPYVSNAGPGPVGDITLSAINFYSIDGANALYIDDVIFDGDSGIEPGTDCNNAIDISAGGSFSSAEVTGELEGFTGSCWTGPDLTANNWYVYTASADGDLTVTTVDIGGTDTEVAAATGSCGDLTEIACDEDFTGAAPWESEITFSVTAGETYYIIWGNGWNGDAFDFEVNFADVLDPCPAPLAVICDNMDDYTLGPIDVQAAHWGPWSVGGTVSNVSDAQAFSNGQSLFVGPGGVEDNLLLLGDQATGQWTIDWMAYVPAGSTGFFNIQADPTAGNSFIYQAYLNQGGAEPGMGSFQQLTETFTYPEDTWFPISLSVDLDAATHSMTVNGVAVLTDAPYVANAGPDPATTLSSINFYSIDANNNLYIDDVIFDGSPNPDGLLDYIESAFNVYPNPTEGNLTISGADNIDAVVVRNVLGSVVRQVNTPYANNVTIDMSDLVSGIYFVEVRVGDAVNVSRVIKK